MKYIARVNPRYFAAATIWMARNDVRYYLNGVAIQPHADKGVVIVATNGHAIYAIHDPDGWCEKDIIVGAIPSQLVAACKAKGNAIKLTKPESLWIAEDGAVVQRGFSEGKPPSTPFDVTKLFSCKIELVDGKFPDWRKVLQWKDSDDAPEVLPVSINPHYLARLGDTASALGYDQGRGRASNPVSVAAYQKSAVHAVNFRMDSSEDLDLVKRLVIAIMPIRNDAPEDPVPSALLIPAKPAAKPRVRVRGNAVMEA